MADFLKGVGAFFVVLLVIFLGFFVVVGFYSLLLVLVYYIGYFAGYIFGLFVPAIKTIHLYQFGYKELFGFLTTIVAMFSANFNFSMKKSY